MPSADMAEETSRIRELIAARNFDEAVRLCRRHLLRQDDVGLRLLLGEALLGTQRFEQVTVEMMALLRKHPEIGALHRILGESYLRSGRLDKAVESLRRALDLDPRDRAARTLLAEATMEEIDPRTPITPQALPQEATSVGSRPTRSNRRDFGREPSVEIDLEFASEIAASTRNLHVTPGPQRRTPVVPPPSSAVDVLGDEDLVIEADSEERTAFTVSPVAEAEIRRVRPRKPTMVGLGVPTRVSTDPTAGAPGPRASQVPKPSIPAPRALPPRPSVVPPPASAIPSRSSTSSPPPSPVFGPQQPPQQAIAPFPSFEPDIENEETAVRESPLTALQEGRASNPPRAPSVAMPSDPAAPPLGSPPPGPSFDPSSYEPSGSLPRRSSPPSGRRAPAGRTTEKTVKARRPDLARTRRMIIGGSLALAVIVVGIGWLLHNRVQMDRALERTIQEAMFDGRRDTLERAISAIEDEGLTDPTRRALHARLLATLMLEHGVDRAGEVRTTLRTLGDEAARSVDARIAESLLLTESGLPDRALEILRGVAPPSNPSELYRARARAALSLGRIDEAEEAARLALEHAEPRPRPIALAALTRFRRGDSAGALALLDRATNADASPAVRAARARVLSESGSDPTRATAEATLVLSDLRARATPCELAWAHLVLASLAAQQGDLARAASEAEEASRGMSLSRPELGVRVTETLIAARSYTLAADALARLPASAIPSEHRAALSAEIAIEQGRLAEAESELLTAGSSAHTELLRGRLAEGRRSFDEAIHHYRNAASEPREAARARTRLGAVMLEAGRPADARLELEHALRLAPADLDALVLFVRATALTGNLDEAERAVARGVREHGERPALAAARGSVMLALGRLDEAISELTRAAEGLPDDAQLRLELGHASMRAGREEQAAEAYRAALAIAPDLLDAKMALFRIAVEGAHWEDAQSEISSFDDESLRNRLSIELAAARGRGEELVAQATSMAEAARTDADLYLAAGALAAQAERDRPARQAFGRALRIDRERIEALIGLVGLDARRGALRPATKTLERAERLAENRAASRRVRARLRSARAWLRYEAEDFTGAQRLAEEALELDPHNAEAHLIEANVSIDRGGDPIPSLRAALAGTYVPAEALGRLAVRLGRGDEACDLARRYIVAAPAGYDRPDVDRVLARCP